MREIKKREQGGKGKGRIIKFIFIYSFSKNNYQISGKNRGIGKPQKKYFFSGQTTKRGGGG